MYIYVCMYVCTHIYDTKVPEDATKVKAHLHQAGLEFNRYVCVCICMYVYVCMYVCMYVHIYMTPKCQRVPPKSRPTFIKQAWNSTGMCVYVYVCMYIYIYMYVCMYVCIYIYI